MLLLCMPISNKERKIYKEVVAITTGDDATE